MTSNSHRDTFNHLLSRFGYSAKQVGTWSGIHESRISRFRSGKLDLEAGEMLQLVQSLPSEAQSHFWKHLLGEALSVNQLLNGMDEDQLADLLCAIAANLGKSKRKKPELQFTAS